jgi:hypothetical protein
MSGQFARLNESLHRAHPTTLNQRIEVFASDLHAILDHYLVTQNQAAKDLLLLRQALEALERGETKLRFAAIDAIKERLI